MKIISLYEPWATLWAGGAKKNETRSWCQRGFRGPVLIHAAKHFTKAERELCRQEPFRSALAGLGIHSPDDFKLMHVVGIAGDLSYVQFRPGYDPGEPERHFGDFTPGRWGWKAGKVRRLPVPIPCRGQQGLKDAPAEVAAEAVRQLREAGPGMGETPMPSPATAERPKEKEWEARIRKINEAAIAECRHAPIEEWRTRCGRCLNWCPAIWHRTLDGQRWCSVCSAKGGVQEAVDYLLRRADATIPPNALVGWKQRFGETEDGETFVVEVLEVDGKRVLKFVG